MKKSLQQRHRQFLNHYPILTMTQDQTAKLRRVFFNAGIFAVASGASAFLTYMQNVDFGSWSAIVAVAIATALKAIQSFTEPAQDVYK